MQRPKEKNTKTPKRGRRKGSQNTAKPKNAIPDIWKALLLVASIIIATTAVSLVVVNVLNARSQPLQGIDFATHDLDTPYATDPEYAGPALPMEPGPTIETAAQPATLPPEPPPRPDRGTLVFVIDDAGHNLHELEPFLRFPGPLTIAVLPGLSHSVEAARRIREAGKEVFLHQPMEAVGGEDPGPGAIYLWMSNDEVLEVLERNLAEISPVAGMNNHQGSKITADERIMETVLAFSREHDISFLDSKTTAVSAAPAIARRMGITIGERNVFIDNEQDRASMRHSIEEGLRIASRRGDAVMIGHIWSPELAPLLKELYQDLVDQGFTFATASQLINNTSR